MNERMHSQSTTARSTISDRAAAFITRFEVMLDGLRSRDPKMAALITDLVRSAYLAGATEATRMAFQAARDSATSDELGEFFDATARELTADLEIDTNTTEPHS